MSGARAPVAAGAADDGSGRDGTGSAHQHRRQQERHDGQEQAGRKVGAAVDMDACEMNTSSRTDF